VLRSRALAAWRHGGSTSAIAGAQTGPLHGSPIAGIANTTLANVKVVHALLHGKEDSTFGDSGYTGVDNALNCKACDAALLTHQGWME